MEDQGMLGVFLRNRCLIEIFLDGGTINDDRSNKNGDDEQKIAVQSKDTHNNDVHDKIKQQIWSSESEGKKREQGKLRDLEVIDMEGVEIQRKESSLTSSILSGTGQNDFDGPDDHNINDINNDMDFGLVKLKDEEDRDEDEEYNIYRGSNQSIKAVDRFTEFHKRVVFRQREEVEESIRKEDDIDSRSQTEGEEEEENNFEQKKVQDYNQNPKILQKIQKEIPITTTPHEERNLNYADQENKLIATLKFQESKTKNLLSEQKKKLTEQETELKKLRSQNQKLVQQLKDKSEMMQEIKSKIPRQSLADFQLLQEKLKLEEQYKKQLEDEVNKEQLKVKVVEEYLTEKISKLETKNTTQIAKLFQLKAKLSLERKNNENTTLEIQRDALKLLEQDKLMENMMEQIASLNNRIEVQRAQENDLSNQIQNLVDQKQNLENDLQKKVNREQGEVKKAQKAEERLKKQRALISVAILNNKIKSQKEVQRVQEEKKVEQEIFKAQIEEEHRKQLDAIQKEKEQLENQKNSFLQKQQTVQKQQKDHFQKAETLTEKKNQHLEKIHEAMRQISEKKISRLKLEEQKQKTQENMRRSIDLFIDNNRDRFKGGHSYLEKLVMQVKNLDNKGSEKRRTKSPRKSFPEIFISQLVDTQNSNKESDRSIILDELTQRDGEIQESEHINGPKEELIGDQEGKDEEKMKNIDINPYICLKEGAEGRKDSNSIPGDSIDRNAGPGHLENIQEVGEMYERSRSGSKALLPDSMININSDSLNCIPKIFVSNFEPKVDNFYQIGEQVDSDLLENTQLGIKELDKIFQKITEKEKSRMRVSIELTDIEKPFPSRKKKKSKVIISDKNMMECSLKHFQSSNHVKIKTGKCKQSSNISLLF